MQNILKTHLGYSNNIDYLGIRTIFKELQIKKRGFIHIIMLSEKPQRKTQLRGCINFNFRN